MIKLTQEHTEIIKKHQTTVPVLVLKIATDLGIPVFRWPCTSEIAGKIVKTKEGKYEIYVRADDPHYRQRFTIAHEIAHFLLHKDIIGDGIRDNALYRSGLSNELEIEANKLAADILMPWHIINEAMDQGNNTIPLLAKFLDVSESAMSVRLGIPC